MSSNIKTVQIKGHDIPIIFESNNFLPIVSMQLVFEGSGQLSSSHEGVAELASKLLQEGTKKAGSVAFATKLDDKAITITTHASRESFTIEVSSLATQWDDAISLLKELLQDPNYSTDVLDRIKRQKIGQIARREADFDYIASVNLRKTLFQGTPLARDLEGTRESVQQITLKDIEDFIATKLGYNNLVVVIGGDITLEKAKENTKQIASLLPKVTPFVLPTIEATNKELDVAIEQNDTQQAYIYFGAPFDFSYQEEGQFKARIAEFILGGGGFGSRIMEEIRVKRGLAYSAYGTLPRTKMVSYLSGYMQTKLENEKKAKELIKEVISDFATKGITQQELDDAKEFLIGSEVLRVETLRQRLLRAYSEYYYGKPLGFTKKDLDNIATVTLEEMNEFIKNHTEITKISFATVTKNK
ncbi:MAG TPA: insulinase family protein [Epsilonproteobacteria bacterium]|nr:insulinase family protein [Campylobacterota bacterium]